VEELTESYRWWKMAAVKQWTGLGASGWKFNLTVGISVDDYPDWTVKYLLSN